MFISDIQNNSFFNSTIQQEKENYIADMLVRTLYSNDVNNAEIYHIFDLFKYKVLGNISV